MNRSFAKATIEVNDGRRIPAIIACCSKCGKTEKISTNNHSGSIPPEAAANRFRNNGWFIANRDGKDICPKCQERKKAPIKETNVVELKPKVDLPREMSREDQRIIFAEINDVYLDEKTGYSSGWNDKKVAEKLGVPWAWVKQVREAHFGKEGDCALSSKIDELRNELKRAFVVSESAKSAEKDAVEAQKLLKQKIEHLQGALVAERAMFKCLEEKINELCREALK